MHRLVLTLGMSGQTQYDKRKTSHIEPTHYTEGYIVVEIDDGAIKRLQMIGSFQLE